MGKVDLKKYYYAIGLSLGTVFGSLLVFFLIVSPLMKTTTALRTETKNLSTELHDLRDKQDVLNKLKERQASIEEDAKTVRNALPTSDELGRLFIQLNSVAVSSGGSLKSVVTDTSSTESTDFPGVVTKSFNLPISMPNYFAFKQFVTNSQTALRLLSLEDYTINATDSGTMNINLTAKTYSRSE